MRATLRAWHRNRDSDSVSMQSMRAGEFKRTERLAKRLIYDIQPEQLLQLTIGSSAVNGVDFSKGAYDFYNRTHRILQPRTVVRLKTVDFFSEPRGSRFDLYVSDLHVHLKLGEVARTLCEDGELEIVAAEGQTT